MLEKTRKVDLPKRGPLHVRLWARVDKSAGPNGCWLWTGTLSSLGYGRIRDENQRNVMVHRAAYELEHGPIPAGLEIDHLCRVRNCVNPAHMEVVTHKENMHRGMSPSAAHVGKTYCANGHPLSGDNLHVGKGGRRVCRACNRARAQAFRNRAKAVL